jgi:hypothetical protein
MSDRLGWHTLAPNKVLQYGDGREVKIGKRLEYQDFDRKEQHKKKRRPAMCEQGMHAAPSISAALHHGDRIPEYWICRVLIEGTSSALSRADKFGPARRYGKFVGSHRTVLGMIPIREYERIVDEYETVHGESESSIARRSIQRAVLQKMRDENMKDGIKVVVR